VLHLSGGNQQKVVIAKSLAQEPRLIIFDEPTRGVDVGAVAEIHKIIRDLAASGAGVVVISSYLPEILDVSDRILVAKSGTIAAEFARSEATPEKILQAAIH
jgi:simple sugar transport system ATP-binding protein